MCPDKSLLSAFVDKEVPHPWEEKLEAHLKECATCKAEVEGFYKLKAMLQRDNENTVSKSPDQELLNRIVSKPAPPKITSVWGRKVNIPVPVAAAAAAFIVFLTGANLWTGYSVIQQEPQLLTNNVTIGADFQDIDLIIELLEAEQGIEANEVMELPSDIPINPVGNPEFLRTTSVRGSSRP